MDDSDLFCPKSVKSSCSMDTVHMVGVTLESISVTSSAVQIT